ncbi:protein LYK5-like [Papaver somniferum]|nr:protein LYK5-like [Papaver somniferum]
MGTVYRGIISGNLAAIKKMNGNITEELNVLTKINHFNLIKLSGVCFNEGHWYLVYEYAVNGSLDNWIFYSTQTLSWTQRVQIALDVAKGLHYLHSCINPSYVHKDIKSSNILLDGDFRAKIANFGLARSAEGYESEFASTRNIVGTTGYMVPEYLENGLVSPKLDVYSFGVVLLEMISGKEAVSESDKELLPSKTLEGILAKENPGENIKDLIDPSLHENYPPDLALSVAKLTESCLQRNPDGRPSMDGIVHSLARFLDVSLSWEISTGTFEKYSSASNSSVTSTWKS